MRHLWLLFFLSFGVSALAQTKVPLKVNVTGIKVKGATLYYAVFNKEEGFLKEESAITHGGVAVKANSVSFDLELVKGIYAITFFQDINGNKKLDKRRFPPIPTEPYGFSNNPRLFGKPKFDKCSFVLDGTKTINVLLKD